MSRTSQESSTAFGEVLRPASQNYSHNPQGRIVSNDNRLMVSASNNDVDIITEKLLYYTTPCFEALTLVRMITEQ